MWTFRHRRKNRASAGKGEGEKGGTVHKPLDERRFLKAIREGAKARSASLKAAKLAGAGEGKPFVRQVPASTWDDQCRLQLWQNSMAPISHAQAHCAPASNNLMAPHL